MIRDLFVLFVLAIPVACVSWTVTHEKVFEPLRNWFKDVHENRRLLNHTLKQGYFERFVRHVAYAPTCEYCFSHYVALLALHMTSTKLLLPGFAGAVLAWFTLVWVANIYMNLHFRLRLAIRESGNRSKEIEAWLSREAS